MKNVDLTQEHVYVISQLDLRPHESVVDTQTDADQMLPLLHGHVGDHGRVIGMAFGAKSVEAVTDMLEEIARPAIELHVAHPLQRTGIRSDSAHGVIVRHTGGVRNIAPVLAEAYRIGRSGARIAAMHTEWQVYLPRMTDKEREMIAALASPAVKNGEEFFYRFNRAAQRHWREVRYDVYSVASRDKRELVRYGYDWRRMMRDQLTKARIFSPREILDLIDRLENTRGAKVVVDRYFAVGVKV